MTDLPRPGSVAGRLSATDTVLVIEDEEDIAEFLGAYFRASGMAMVHLDPASADEVAGAVLEHRPRCVLLDLHLRGFSGLDAYRRLRADPANALLPVIIVSADSRPDVQRDALSGGVDAFVTKPFNVKSLFALVQERMARAGMRAAISASPDRGDTITGLATHSYLQDRLADEIGLSAHAERPVALALLRLRSLRETNQRFGHAAGDVVLREVGRRLGQAFPDAAVLGRNAGAEFAVVLAGAGVDGAAASVREAVRAAATPVELPGGGAAEVALCAGLAVHPDHAPDRDGLFMAADVALAAACESDEVVRVAL
jgi:two-component system, cell cycle response regulator